MVVGAGRVAALTCRVGEEARSWTQDPALRSQKAADEPTSTASDEGFLGVFLGLRAVGLRFTAEQLFCVACQSVFRI